MTNESLVNVVGGIKWSATLFNALTKVFEAIYNIGRRFGTTVLRIGNNSSCGLN